MKGIFQRLFGGSQPVTIADLKNALKEVERDRRKSRMEVRRWERKRKQLLDKMKKSRKDGAQLEVDYLWEEFKAHRRSGADLRREGKTYNLEGIALKRYISALERLERRNERDSASKLLERIAHSGLAERLSLERESEQRYLEEMNSILDEFGGSEEEETEDVEKALFLAELDGIHRAESQGNEEEAQTREEELLERFSDEPESEAP